MGEYDVRLDGPDDQEIYQDLLVMELKRIRKQGPENYKLRRDREMSLFSRYGMTDQNNNKSNNNNNNQRPNNSLQPKQEVVQTQYPIVKGRDARQSAPWMGMKIGANIDRGLAWLHTFLLGVVVTIGVPILYFIYIFIQEWLHTSHGMMYWFNPK